MGLNREDSEEDLDGADVVLPLTILSSFLSFFFLSSFFKNTLFFKNKPEGDTNVHARGMGIFGEFVD